MRAIALLLSALLAAPAGAAGDAVESALSKELARAKTELKEDGYPPAYYVGLTAIDLDSWEQRCTLGAPYFSGGYTQRLITPDVRVGGYELDSHPVSNLSGFQARGAAYTDDEQALRYGLWLQLDSAYKAAAADFLRKQGLRVARGKTDYDTDDLTREAPRERRLSRPVSAWSTTDLAALCGAGRALAREPGLLSADSTVRLRRQWSRLRDTEGSAVDFGRDTAELELEASVPSPDGTRLYASRRFVATTPKAVPAPAVVEAAAEDMLKDLRALKVASTTSPFSAPALLDPSVAAAVVLSVGLRLSGEEQRNPQGAQTFRGKLGKPVLLPEFSLVDDPTVAEFQGKPLAGHYEFDDQGIPAQKVTLIDKGILKGMLLSRYPVVGFSKSNGHGRAFAGYAPEGLPGSLFLFAKKQYSEKELLKRLRETCKKRGKPYGIWVRKLRSFSQQQGTGGHASIRFMGGLVYLVDAKTGQLTLVRDLDLVGTPLALLGNILAAGRDVEASDTVYGAPVSVVVPSLLLSDGELQRSEARPEKPPILPPPNEAAAAPPAPGPGRKASSSRRIPTIPNLAHTQVRRYIIRGAGRMYPKFVMQDVADSRQHLEGDDDYLDFKVVAASLGELGSAQRRLDDAIARLAAGKTVDSSALCGAMPLVEYKARYGDDWPR
jgi:predicted Zn-dependent protease